MRILLPYIPPHPQKVCSKYNFITTLLNHILNFPSGVSGKQPVRQCRRCRRHWSNPCIEKMPWRRAWQLTPVFLPGESHGQRSLACYGPYGPKELDTTEATQHSRIHILQILSAEAHSILWLWLYCFLYSFGLPSDNYSLFFFNYFIFNVPRTFHSQILYRTMNLLTSLA